MITQKFLKFLFTYDEYTGLFTRNITRGNQIAGTIAGYNKDGYTYIRIDGKNYAAHNLAWLYITGEFCKEFIDHKDRERSNNRWNNLREVTIAVNNKNLSINKNNKSGITGVSWDKAINKWKVTIQVNGIKKHLGTFSDIEVARVIRLGAEGWYGFNKGHGT